LQSPASRYNLNASEIKVKMLDILRIDGLNENATFGNAKMFDKITKFNSTPIYLG